ncbi:MAG: glycoside hydrolase family 30 protein [Salibacteraceae bacterium]|nr:glycoside hydrolase family 30 protein [Salibacteraceae bacterium]
MNFRLLLIFFVFIACNSKREQHLSVRVFQTSASGDKLTEKSLSESQKSPEHTVQINPNKKFQVITGIGGAFTESSASILNQLSKSNRVKIMKAYFSDSGANYSLTRTHINSCDFSLGTYSYDSVVNDTQLQYFDISPDKNDLIPMIKEAQAISNEGFKIIASPWTAPPWMKDNNSWKGGKLLPKYYTTWANYLVKYIDEYKKEGIPIWALTIENEPLGNGENWESMHYTPQEMASFIKSHLGPTLDKNNLETELLVYDQNRGEDLNAWSSILLTDSMLEPYIYGTAVHWYSSTVDWFPQSLQQTHAYAPQKHIIQTEGCIDAEIPKWKDDAWYWKKEATDWGWDWAIEEDKPNHPKYVPTYRYARDIIGCMNNWVEGWIDWNMVLDKKGGPNWANNWCIAPVIADPEKDEVYFTPLYYVMAHFSKYFRPNSRRIECISTSDGLLVTAVENTTGSIAVAVLNEQNDPLTFNLKIGSQSQIVEIEGKALQTIIVNGKSILKKAN